MSIEIQREFPHRCRSVHETCAICDYVRLKAAKIKAHTRLVEAKLRSRARRGWRPTFTG